MLHKKKAVHTTVLHESLTPSGGKTNFFIAASNICWGSHLNFLRVTTLMAKILRFFSPDFYESVVTLHKTVSVFTMGHFSTESQGFLRLRTDEKTSRNEP